MTAPGARPGFSAAGPNRRGLRLGLCGLVLCGFAWGSPAAVPFVPMAGEVTEESVLLQVRLNEGTRLVNGDLPGSATEACFEVCGSDRFEEAVRTGWVRADPERDFIVRARVAGLQRGTRYRYRVLYGDRAAPSFSATGAFRTLYGSAMAGEATFATLTGMNYHPFVHGTGGRGPAGARDLERKLGYPSLEALCRLKPDFLVATGDSVYYDRPSGPQGARTLEQMRRKWHEQFALPRFSAFFLSVPVFWEVDDHDYRRDDSDPSSDDEPSAALGMRVFLEQVPSTAPSEDPSATYRTRRVSKDLQIWLPQGRFYRSPNAQTDGPGKSLWGTAQRRWLMESLEASDATFKVLVSPTPLVGPDDARKRDNHTNPLGFRHEGDLFFRWLTEKQFLKKGFFIVCGDRHWQYHSVHPSGFEEFSCGAFVDENARIGRRPGDPESTDPEGRIRQPFLQPRSGGGFLLTTVLPARQGSPASITFSFHDEDGRRGYSTTRQASSVQARD